MENAVAKVQSEIESEILDSETTHAVTLERLEQKHAKFKQNLEKQHDKKRKKFQQNAIKEQQAQKSHIDTGHKKPTKVESILCKSNLEQRVMVEGNKNSADVCITKRTIDQFSLRSLPRKILRITENLERKEVRHMLRHCKVLEHQTQENQDFDKTVGIDLECMYTRLREDELLGSDTLSSRPRLCTDTSSQNSSRYRNVSSDLDGKEKIMRS